MKKIIVSLLVFLCSIGTGYSQDSSMDVLYVGNSYISTNNLPLMVLMMSINCNQPMSYTSDFVVTPGGATFQDHCGGRAMSLIRQGGWDYVILQEQSQYPAFPISQVEQDCFPYAQQLVDSIYANSPCAVPLFFMTWGYKNGDPENAKVFPPIGTYEGMDSLLYARYMIMKEQNDAAVAPVGRVWRYIRTNYPDIELYQADGSHPSQAGTYAAAATIFTMIHQADPTAITHYENLSEEVARNILQAVKTVTYDSLDRWIRPMPVADFSLSGNLNAVVFGNASRNATAYYWDFGDGTTSEEQNPTHTYSTAGEYTVTLVAQRHCMYDTVTTTIRVNQSSVSIQEIDKFDCTVYPNPANKSVTVQNADERIKAVFVYDVAGRMIDAKEVNDYSVCLDVQALDKGLYIIRITTQTGTQIYRKLLVE